MRLTAAASFLAQSLFKIPLDNDFKSVAGGATDDDHEARQRRQLLLFEHDQQQKRDYFLDKKRDQEGDEQTTKLFHEAFQANSKGRWVRKFETLDDDDVESLMSALDDQFHKECTPEEDTDAAFGILGDCAPDEQCVESELSKTGGVCLKATASNFRRRHLQNNEPEYYCDSPNYDCSCDGFDRDTNIGYLTCTYPVGCFLNAPDVCGYFNNFIYFTGDIAAVNATYCLYITAGDANFDALCYGVTVEDLTCRIGVYSNNGATEEECSACTRDVCPATFELPVGAVFDCTNTVLGNAGEVCEGYYINPYLNNGPPPPSMPVTTTPQPTPMPATGPTTRQPTSTTPVVPTALPPAGVTEPSTSAGVSKHVMMSVATAIAVGMTAASLLMCS